MRPVLFSGVVEQPRTTKPRAQTWQPPSEPYYYWGENISDIRQTAHVNIYHKLCQALGMRQCLAPVDNFSEPDSENRKLIGCGNQVFELTDDDTGCHQSVHNELCEKVYIADLLLFADNRLLHSKGRKKGRINEDVFSEIMTRFLTLVKELVAHPDARKGVHKARSQQELEAYYWDFHQRLLALCNIERKG